MHQNLGVELLMYGAFGALGAVFVDIRFASAATVYAVGGLLAAWRPDLALFIGGFANLLALLPMAVMWARIARPECDEVGLP